MFRGEFTKVDCREFDREKLSCRFREECPRLCLLYKPRKNNKKEDTGNSINRDESVPAER